MTMTHILRAISLALLFTPGWFVSDSIAQAGRVLWLDLTAQKSVIGLDGTSWSWIKYNPTKLPDDNNVITEFWANVDKGFLHVNPRGRDIVATLDGQVPLVSLLNEGEIVGPSSDWQATVLADGSEQRNAMLPLVSSAAYTVWHGKTGYVGVQILPKNHVHYGWIKLRISQDGRELDVLEIAFHADPDQPIAAGYAGERVETAVTQTSGSLCFSITNAGNIGYTSLADESRASSCPPTEDESLGIGMYYKGRSLLFEAGLLLGVDASHVLSTVRGSSYLFWQDEDLSQRPGSIMRVLKDQGAQRGRVELEDAHARNRIGLYIIQDSFSFSNAEDSDYIVLRYKIANWSQADIENMYAGLWVDWDLGEDFRQNSMDFDENRNMGFARADMGTDYPVAGIRVLSQAYPAVTSFAANTGSELDSDASFNLLLREAKWEVISGTRQRRYLVGADVFQIASVGPIQIAVGETAEVVFALVAGDNVEDLRRNADRALAKYQGGIPISVEGSGPIPDWITIGKVFPNPITDQATFPYKLSQNNAQVEVEVYDLLGRKLSHLLSARKQAGEHMLTWNAQQMSLPSGMYAVRWTVSYAARQHQEIRFVAVY